MSEMISVKLLNQYHTRSFADVPDHLDDENNDGDVGRESFLDDVRQPPLTELGYETVNQLDLGDIESLNGPQLPAINAEPMLPDHIKENGIEDEVLINDRSAIDQQMLGGDWMKSVDSKPNRQTIRGPRDDLDAGNRSITPTTSTMTTLTTTRTVQSSTITVRKVRRKMRRKLYTTSTSPGTIETERPLTTSTSTATPEPLSTSASSSSSKPIGLPRIDITKLNLQHLEDEFLAYPTYGIPNRMHPSRTATRFRPRSMKRSTDIVPPLRMPASARSPTCGCRQSRKRRARKINYSYDVGGTDDAENELNDSGPEYDYGDYNGLGRSAPGDAARLFPVVSQLLAQEENGENSAERAQMVHGALERLMGIVTIFSHVDELIQRRTKKSIRRLARFYESDEMY
ncbi:hypothetical protein AND_007563 [Anopheles darlingi]|uniref:Uncharacterized protein n=1 Tax=Anopheles darlingi TaxID=43151 RepID=W5JBN7_ANODA|nr:hypothetical protein AND_007563 [Anopheles darlingi]